MTGLRQIIFLFGILTLLTDCIDPKQKGPNTDRQTTGLESGTATPKVRQNIVHGLYSEGKGQVCKCPAEFALRDSSKLTHIKGLFYINEAGHLYNKTMGQRELNRNLVDHEYFNGYFSQEVDPLSFEALGGWYAKDKKNVYYYRPVSGGMQISKIEKADRNTFKILKGQYRYALDKNHVFEDASIIANLKPSNLKTLKNKNGELIGLISGDTQYAIK